MRQKTALNASDVLRGKEHMLRKKAEKNIIEQREILHFHSLKIHAHKHSKSQH